MRSIVAEGDFCLATLSLIYAMLNAITLYYFVAWSA
jgi:hypothetical protein